MPRFSERIDGVVIGGPIQNVAVAHDIHPEMERLLCEAGYNPAPERLPSGIGKEDRVGELFSFLQEHESEAAVVRTSVPFEDPRVFEECEKLRLLIGACRKPRIDTDLALGNGVWTFRSNANVKFVARRVKTLLMSLSEGLLQGVTSRHVGDWKKGMIDSQMFELSEARVGVWGLGQIGEEVAKLISQEGIEVFVYNDGPGNRTADRERSGFARALGNVHVVQTPEELVKNVDILTLHANPNGWDGASNKGILTKELLERLGANRGDSTVPKTLVNWARRSLVEPTDEEIAGLIKDDKLGFYLPDVYDPETENAEACKPLSDLLSDSHQYRILGTPHIGGSGPRTGYETARQVTEWHLPAWERGYFDRDQHIAFRDHDMEDMGGKWLGATERGLKERIVFTVTTGVKSGTKASLLTMLSDLSLDSIGEHHVSDSADGSDEKYDFVHRTYVSVLNGEPYKESVARTSQQLIALRGRQGVVGVRYIPASNKQRQALLDMPSWT